MKLFSLLIFRSPSSVPIYYSSAFSYCISSLLHVPSLFWMIDRCLLAASDTALAGVDHSLHFPVAVPSLWSTFLLNAQSWGGRWCWEMVGEQHVLKKVTVCCFAVLHLVEVVTPQVPTFQPIAIHLLPHPLPLVHLPLRAASGNLPLLALHQSVQTLLHLYTMAGLLTNPRLTQQQRKQ